MFNSIPYLLLPGYSTNPVSIMPKLSSKSREASNKPRFDLFVEDLFNSLKGVVYSSSSTLSSFTLNPNILGPTLLLPQLKALDKFSAAEAKDSPPALTLPGTGGLPASPSSLTEGWEKTQLCLCQIIYLLNN